jgi:hypothetical protein
MARPARAIAYVSAVLGGTLVAFAGLLPINDYVAPGMTSGYDCDGPFEVMLLLVPGALLSFCGVVSLATRHPRSRPTVIWSVVSGIAFAVAMTRVPELLREQSRNAEVDSPCH